ncbi:hypothetical protein Trydic_g118 [Trypoxylus dichotomus]
MCEVSSAYKHIPALEILVGKSFRSSTAVPPHPRCPLALLIPALIYVCSYLKRNYAVLSSTRSRHDDDDLYCDDLGGWKRGKDADKARWNYGKDYVATAFAARRVLPSSG